MKQTPKTRKSHFRLFTKSQAGNIYPAGNYLPFDIFQFEMKIGDDSLSDYTGEFLGRIEDDPAWRNNYGETVHVSHPDGHHIGYVPASSLAGLRDFMTLPCDCCVFIQRRKDDYGPYYHAYCYVKAPGVD